VPLVIVLMLGIIRARSSQRAKRHLGLLDKGARLVRYSKGTNRAGIRFSWVTLGAYSWRCKLGLLCRMLNLTPDNHTAVLKEWYGRNWVHFLRPLIDAIRLPEFASEEEARVSLCAVWVVAVDERERRRHRRGADTRTPKRSQFPARKAASAAAPVAAWASWIDRTLKEDCR